MSRITDFDNNIEIVPFSGCWIWLGSIAKNGYGKIGAKLAHRVSFIKKHGGIPEGLQIDHLCRTRCCVNPDHLEAVTQKENILRSNSWSAKNAKKTHCDNGHEYTESNTITRVNGWRLCGICDAEHKRRSRAKAKLRAEGVTNGTC